MGLTHSRNAAYCPSDGQSDRKHECIDHNLAPRKKHRRRRPFRGENAAEGAFDPRRLCCCRATAHSRGSGAARRRHPADGASPDPDPRRGGISRAGPRRRPDHAGLLGAAARRQSARHQSDPPGIAAASREPCARDRRAGESRHPAPASDALSGRSGETVASYNLQSIWKDLSRLLLVDRQGDPCPPSRAGAARLPPATSR